MGGDVVISFSPKRLFVYNISVSHSSNCEICFHISVKYQLTISQARPKQQLRYMERFCHYDVTCAIG